MLTRVSWPVSILELALTLQARLVPYSVAEQARPPFGLVWLDTKMLSLQLPQVNINLCPASKSGMSNWFRSFFLSPPCAVIVLWADSALSISLSRVFKHWYLSKLESALTSQAFAFIFYTPPLKLRCLMPHYTQSIQISHKEQQLSQRHGHHTGS